MFPRAINIPKRDSFFLFGARGVGKSTLIRTAFPSAHVIDLLHPAVEREFQLSPGALTARLAALPEAPQTILIDEVQKVPRLLDEVHAAIEGPHSRHRFILSGSSARKLKAGGANLLAGRAAVRHLHPLTHEELGADFQLEKAMRWGTLPRSWLAEEDDERFDRLEAYAQTYLKEEVWGEQLVRKLEPFRRFLEVSAQSNGKIINAQNIARDVGADPKTVQSYFQLLEDTLIGFQLDAFDTSLRKRVRHAPKFYYFDTGVARALGHLLKVELREGTSAYGDAFECFVVNEVFRRSQYERLDYRLSHLRTPAGVEVDLVIERPGRPLALVEVKSTSLVREDHVSRLSRIAADFGDAEAFLLSRDPVRKRFGNVVALPWPEGVRGL